MGCFGWLDSNIEKGNLRYGREIRFLLPNDEKVKEEFFKTFPNAECLYDRKQNALVDNSYDSYGHIGSLDIYEMTAFLNLSSTLQSREKVQEIVDNVLRKPKKEDYSDSFYYERAMKLYKTDIEDIWEYFDNPQKYHSSAELTDSTRELGIAIGCYDEQNARLPYPIKVTASHTLKYEDAVFSMGDPCQAGGNIRKSELYEEIQLRNKILESLGKTDKVIDAEPFKEQRFEDMSYEEQKAVVCSHMSIIEDSSYEAYKDGQVTEDEWEDETSKAVYLVTVYSDDGYDNDIDSFVIHADDLDGDLSFENAEEVAIHEVISRGLYEEFEEEEVVNDEIER